jgi:hypothetical protein
MGATKYKQNKPTAEVLMTSMRSMGYSFESAIADVVDNSISANATEVVIRFPIDPAECFIAICDNGTGMSPEELFDAMKYGSEQKLGGRSNSDLGRFGLGLKSASLSQCRRLSVISKKKGVVSAYVWDLDLVQKMKDWVMIECDAEQIKAIKYASYLDTVEHGTVVLWEDFDFIEKASANTYAELNKLQESTSKYLSLIFHRFINGETQNPLKIKINNFTIEPLDPFLENHKKTNIRRRVEIPIKDTDGIERMVYVQPFVLPFQKDLSPEDKRLSGGLENYRSKQGFYIYRNKRLIVWGTWFGRPRDELTKYARIKVDIPNTLDDIWGIDIKKQNAKIPSSIKNRLTKAVDDAMDVAVKAQTYRGRIEKIDDTVDYIWDRVKIRENQYVYRINRDSRIFDLLKEKASDEVMTRLDMVLTEIERSIPYQQIYIDKSQNRMDEEVATDQRKSELLEEAEMLISMARLMGNTDRSEVVEKLFVSEPFISYPELKDILLKEESK